MAPFHFFFFTVQGLELTKMFVLPMNFILWDLLVTRQREAVTWLNKVDLITNAGLNSISSPPRASAHVAGHNKRIGIK